MVAVTVGYGAHFFVAVGGEFLDVALIEFAANGVDLAEDCTFTAFIEEDYHI